MNVLVQCSICLDQFSGDQEEDMHATKCGHIFHKSCIDPWVKKSKNCPECRVTLTNRNIFKLYLKCDKQTAVKRKSTDSEKNLTVQNQFLEESKKKLLKEIDTLKIQLGEATSESMAVKKRFEEQLAEKDEIIKRLKNRNSNHESNTPSKNRIRKPNSDFENSQNQHHSWRNYPDHDDDYSSETGYAHRSKRVKKNWPEDNIGFSTPLSGYNRWMGSDQLNEEIHRFRDNCQSQLNNVKGRVMNACAQMHFDYDRVW